MMAINTPPWEELKTDAKNMEMVMLREFGFFAQVMPPHPFAYTLGINLELDMELLKRAWVLCNGASMTALCVRYKPAIIACGCIHLAAKQTGFAMPSQPPWYRLVEGASKKVLDIIATSILAFHAVEKVEYVDLSGRGRGPRRLEREDHDRGRRRSRSRSREDRRQRQRRDSSRDYGGVR